MSQVFRVEKTKNFTVMCNHHMKDKTDVKGERTSICDAQSAG